MQAVDSDDFAEFVVERVSDGRGGEREDFAGPELLTMREVAEQYLAARGLRRRIWNAPLPRRIKSALEAGNTSPERSPRDDHVGGVASTRSRRIDDDSRPRRLMPKEDRESSM